MCIYSQANFQVNTEVTAEWERAIQGVCVTATRVFWKCLFAAWKESHTLCAHKTEPPLSSCQHHCGAHKYSYVFKINCLFLFSIWEVFKLSKQHLLSYFWIYAESALKTTMQYLSRTGEIPNCVLHTVQNYYSISLHYKEQKHAR